MADSSTVWSGHIGGHRVEVSGPFDDAPSAGPDPTLIRPHHLQVRIDGDEADLDQLEPLLQGDDPDALSLRQALDRVHAR